MGRYVTSEDMEVWCEKTIEEAPLSSLKTAAEHLLVSNRNAQRALEVERLVTAELRAEAHQLRVNLHMERDRAAALEARLIAAVEQERRRCRQIVEDEISAYRTAAAFGVDDIDATLHTIAAHIAGEETK